ncbi:Glycosyl transferases group 1 [Macrococcoides canis]|uniref:Glycosyl transferases group 1 n=1 Tax=Macrococcoides canis TaxID=1855823 RepID=A0A1W7AAU9_9STAP|nr:glycosyltransferase family 4 protein [Macrococcus canis]ARQ06526.1 Glycosyl transferases group 1 [Macrococcus canis]
MKYLLITNAYPSEDKIYSNAFIHRRVKAYQQAGLEIEVVVMTTKVKFDVEYDGVTVKYLDEYQIADYVNNHQFHKLLFHFMNLKMFQAINMMHTVPPIIIWMHGFEAEPWFSRYYNFLSSKQSFLNVMERKDTYFEEVKEMFLALMDKKQYDATFIYVSKSYKEKYVDPYLGRVPEHYYIIHNPINESLFPYRQKKAEDRFHICNIRPYTAKNYANDITRDVILGLSKKKYFDKLTFELHGDGPLFDEITKPLERFSNVTLNKAFIQQYEIHEIHARNGIYLGPTRHDSQGVSLCEAMSSGLVPISNDIGAIKEFIADKETGLVAGRDDVEGMIERIDFLINQPDEFLRLSYNAAQEIRRLTGEQIITKKELEVIKG